MKPKSASAKGKALEDYIANEIRQKGLDAKAERSIGSGNGNREKADISTNALILGRNIAIEAKNWATASVKDWWKQATRVEEQNHAEPIVVYKLGGEGLNKNDVKAIIRLDTLLDLIVATSTKQEVLVREITEGSTRDIKYRAQRLKQSTSELIRALDEYSL